MLNKGITDAVAYLSWPGLAVAFFLGDRHGSRFHINQALVLSLAMFALSLLANLPLVGWIIGILGGLFCAACWFIGVINALQGVEKPLPLLGQFHIL